MDKNYTGNTKDIYKSEYSNYILKFKNYVKRKIMVFNFICNIISILNKFLELIYKFKTLNNLYVNINYNVDTYFKFILKNNKLVYPLINEDYFIQLNILVRKEYG